MKTKLFTYILFSALLFVSSLTTAQENPWKTNSDQNPWDKNDSGITSKPKETENRINKTRSLSVDEVLFIYDNYSTTAKIESPEFNYELKKHVREHYNSKPMFWSAFVTGLILNVYSIPLNLVVSLIPSKQTRKAFENFAASNPNLDDKTLKKYNQRLRLKKFGSGTGGTFAGIATGIGLLLLIAVILF